MRMRNFSIVTRVRGTLAFTFRQILLQKVAFIAQCVIFSDQLKKHSPILSQWVENNPELFEAPSSIAFARSAGRIEW